ncbi:MAG: DUF493 family protein [Lentisphaeria bacterium]
MNTKKIQNSILKFPLKWHSRLIVLTSETSPENEIRQIFASFCIELQELKKGNLSSNGKYQTWQFSAKINDVTTYKALHHALRNVHGAKMLL